MQKLNSIYISSQIRGFIEIARKEGKTFVLVISQGTKLSKPLIEKIIENSGEIIRVGGNVSKRIFAPVLISKELLDIYIKDYQRRAGWSTEIY